MTDYNPTNDYDPQWEEPTIEFHPLAVDLQMLIDENARNLIKDMEIEEVYSPYDAVAVILPYLKPIKR